MEDTTLQSPFKGRWQIAAVFAAELAAGAAAVVYLEQHYSGVMNANFLITLPLLGIIHCFTTQPPSGAKRKKAYHALQVVIFTLPLALLWSYFPNLSYEEAKKAIQSEKGTQILPAEKRNFSLRDSGNPFITKGYYFLLRESGRDIEYIVNPVNGKIAQLPGS